MSFPGPYERHYTEVEMIILRACENGYTGELKGTRRCNGCAKYVHKDLFPTFLGKVQWTCWNCMMEIAAVYMQAKR